MDPKVWEDLHLSAFFERAEEFDVIHNSFDFLLLTFAILTFAMNTESVNGVAGKGNFKPQNQLTIAVARQSNDE